jgi:hypothetical protein
MKTNSAIKRLSGLLIAGSIAVLTGCSADKTTATTTTNKALVTGKRGTARKSVPPAKSSQATASTNTEPARIFDEETDSFISNPDYHEPPRPAPAKQSGQRTEPRRIFNAITRNFEINPDYHEPAGAMEGTRPPNRATEPDRIFDAETGNFEPNPASGVR